MLSEANTMARSMAYAASNLQVVTSEDLVALADSSIVR